MEINTPVKVANSGGLSHDSESLGCPDYTYSKFINYIQKKPATKEWLHTQKI